MESDGNLVIRGRENLLVDKIIYGFDKQLPESCRFSEDSCKLE